MDRASILRQAGLLIDSGDYAAAQKLCARYCREHESDVAALNLMGRAYTGLGRFEPAIDMLERVSRLLPKDAVAMCNLARVYTLAGKNDEALEAYEAALSRDPRYYNAFMEMASIYKKCGNFEQALWCYDQVKSINSAYAPAYYNAGVIQAEKRFYSQAIDELEKAIALQPGFYHARVALAMVLSNAGFLKQSIQTFNDLLTADANDFNLRRKLARVLMRAGDYLLAVRQLLLVAENSPNDPDVLFDLGNALDSCGDREGAVAALEKSYRLRPDNIEAANNYAVYLGKTGEYDLAVEVLGQVLKSNPDNAATLNNLAMIESERGKFVKAIHLLHRVIDIQPGYATAHSNLLFLNSYNVLKSPAEMLAESRHWDAVQGAAGRAARYVHERPAADGRRLHIGYVSPDFCRHSVSFFFEPILAAHRQRGAVDVSCYAEQLKVDDVTERLRGLATHWRETNGRSDAEVAAQIKADGIDILIDLAGHTASNRLGVFTYKPAPVQATYLGYFATTGLEAMDYWLSDEVLTPPDTVEQSCETIVRLPRCCLVYTAPAEAPAVVERPAGQVLVFGSFNDLSKAGPGSVEAWSEILRRVPDARLMLKARQLSDEQQREAWWRRFEAEGIGRERIDLRGRTKGMLEHLALYGEVDIALDTMPRTGGTTTAEALWMGVPVISLAGERFIERLSASMLRAAGLDELVAEDTEGYIDRAVKLAGDEARRRDLRAGLRQRLESSPLCDATGLAQSLEAACRDMWRRWCEGG